MNKPTDIVIWVFFRVSVICESLCYLHHQPQEDVCHQRPSPWPCGKELCSATDTITSEQLSKQAFEQSIQPWLSIPSKSRFSKKKVGELWGLTAEVASTYLILMDGTWLALLEAGLPFGWWFAHDTTLEGFIKPAYCQEVDNLVESCIEISLHLNMSKIKEIVVDFRRKWGFLPLSYDFLKSFYIYIYTATFLYFH